MINSILATGVLLPSLLWAQPRVVELGPLKGHTYAVTAIAFCGNSCLATTEGEEAGVWLWSLETKKVERRMRLPEGGTTQLLAFSPDRKVLGACEYGFFALWDLASSRELIHFRPEPRRAVYTFAFSPDAKLVTVAVNNSLYEYSLAKGTFRKKHVFSGYALVTGLSYSSDSKKLVLWKVWNMDKSFVGAVIDYETGKTSAEMKGGHALPVSASCFIDKDRALATGGFDSRVVLWDPTEGKRIATFRLDGSAIRSLDYSSKTGILVAGTEAGMIWLFDVARRKVIRTINGDPITCLRISPDGQTLAVAIGDDNANAEAPINKGILRLFNVKE